MDTNRTNRDEEIVSVFAITVEALDHLFSPLELTEEQSEEVKGDLFVWFHRLTRRSGNGEIPVERLRLWLVWGAWRLASDLWKLKNNSIPIFPGDPKEIAKELGITLEGAEEEPRR